MASPTFALPTLVIACLVIASAATTNPGHRKGIIRKQKRAQRIPADIDSRGQLHQHSYQATVTDSEKANGAATTSVGPKRSLMRRQKKRVQRIPADIDSNGELHQHSFDAPLAVYEKDDEHDNDDFVVNYLAQLDPKKAKELLRKAIRKRRASQGKTMGSSSDDGGEGEQESSTTEDGEQSGENEDEGDRAGPSLSENGRRKHRPKKNQSGEDSFVQRNATQKRQSSVQKDGGEGKQEHAKVADVGEEAEENATQNDEDDMPEDEGDKPEGEKENDMAEDDGESEQEPAENIASGEPALAQSHPEKAEELLRNVTQNRRPSTMENDGSESQRHSGGTGDGGEAGSKNDTQENDEDEGEEDSGMVGDGGELD